MRVLLTAVLALGSCNQPERMAGISDRRWNASGEGWRIAYQARGGAEIEGWLTVGISSNAFTFTFVVERAAAVESHRVRSAIEQSLAERGLTIDSAVVGEITSAIVGVAEAGAGVATNAVPESKRE